MSFFAKETQGQLSFFSSRILRDNRVKIRSWNYSQRETLCPSEAQCIKSWTERFKKSFSVKYIRNCVPENCDLKRKDI